MMANSPEYRVMCEKGPDLRVAFQSVLSALSECLRKEKLITDDNQADINNPYPPMADRAGKLVGLIRDKVKLDPAANYRRFFKALQQDEDQFSEIISILKKSGVVPSQAGTTSGGVPPLVTHHGTDRMNCVVASKDIGIIAEHVPKWQGRIADELGLTVADVEAIKTKYPADLQLQTKEALLIWKRRSGDRATYSNLMQVFLSADCQQYSDTVKKLAVPNASEKRGAIGGNDTNSSGQRANKNVIEMPPEYGRGHGVQIDNGDVEETEEFRWCVGPLRKDPGQGTTSIGRQMSRASLQQSNLWDVKELNVKFLDPIPSNWAFCEGGNNLNSIMSLAERWNRKGKHIPQIKRVELSDPAHIRVRFTASETSRSYVGVQAQDVKSQKEPTMWLNLSEGGDEYKEHLVVHEFGHALGLDHEHQRGDFWSLIKPFVNETAMKSDPQIGGVYETYTADLVFGASDRKTTKYDPNSVMHYWFKSCWLKEDYNTEEKVTNARISLDTKAALLGILQRSKGTLVTEPSKQDLDFLDERYREKKESKKNGTDGGKGIHTDVEEGPAQLPHTELEETPKPPPTKGPVKPPNAEEEPTKPTPVEGPKQPPHAKEETPKPTPVKEPPQPQPAKEKAVQQPPADQGAAPHTEKIPQWIRILLFISNICCQGIEQLGAKNIVIALLFAVCAILWYSR